MFTPGTNPYVVEKNLEKMIDPSYGGMVGLLFDESIGGNAGDWNGLPCAGTNFVFDRYTGEILCFDNYQGLSPELRKKPRGIMRVAVDVREGSAGIFRVISYQLDAKRLYRSVHKNIEESIRRFNNEYGFADPSLLKVLK